MNRTSLIGLKKGKRDAVNPSTSDPSKSWSLDDSKYAELAHDLAAKAAEEKKIDFDMTLPPSLLSETANGQDCIAPFRREEIMLGLLLGSGEFSNVYEVKSIHLGPQDEDEDNISPKEFKTRLHMKNSDKYRQTDKARYAVKHIKNDYLMKCIEENRVGMYAQAAR